MKKVSVLGTVRIFNASLDDVWSMWTNSEVLDCWWGPKGHTQVTSEFSFKEGGRWHFVMKAPQGQEYINEMEFGAITPKKKIVLHHRSLPPFTIEASFEEVEKGRTRLEFKAIFPDPKVLSHVIDFAILGNVEHQQKFEALLAKRLHTIAPIEFQIDHQHQLPLKVAWDAFTKPEVMAKWFGDMTTRTMDFRRGGFYHYGNEKEWGLLEYIDIVLEKRLIYLNSFSNKEKMRVRHPQAPLMPMELMTIASFHPKSIEIRWYPLNATHEEIAFFNQNHENFNIGWKNYFERLDRVADNL